VTRLSSEEDGIDSLAVTLLMAEFVVSLTETLMSWEFVEGSGANKD
jgi:hypothetical protein